MSINSFIVGEDLRRMSNAAGRKEIRKECSTNCDDETLSLNGESVRIPVRKEFKFNARFSARDDAASKAARSAVAVMTGSSKQNPSAFPPISCIRKGLNGNSQPLRLTNKPHNKRKRELREESELSFERFLQLGYNDALADNDDSLSFEGKLYNSYIRVYNAFSVC